MTGTANREAREAWNGESGQRWVRDAERRDSFAEPVGAALLAAAALRPGEAVLDVGCGCGATTFAAAGAVGSGGHANGIDLSEPMLAVARARLEAAQIANVTFTAADAQTHPFERGTHDVAMSRFGTMFFDDPLEAFVNVAGAIRPGGRLCIATWQPLVENDWLVIPGTALLRYGTLPDTTAGGPGMFAQSDPSVIRATLERAGFQDIGVEKRTVMLRLGDDPRDATDHLADMGFGRAVLATVDEADQHQALDAVAEALQDHASTDGVRLPGGILITTATR